MANQPSPQQFTRLPTSDPILNDLYDKLARLQPSPPPTPASLPEPPKRLVQTIRVVQTSTHLTPADTTILAILTAPAVMILPDAAACPGKIFYLKNDQTSGDDFTLGTYKLHQTVDRQDPGSFTVLPEHAITVQSDGQNWIVLSTYL